MGRHWSSLLRGDDAAYTVARDALVRVNEAALALHPVTARMARAVVLGAIRVTDSSSALATVVDAGNGEHVIAAVCDTSEAIDEMRAGAPFGVVSEALAARLRETQTGFFCNASTDTAPRALLSNRRLEMRSLMALPALSAGKLWGAVVVANAERDYTSDDLAVLGNLASSYGFGLRRADVLRELAAVDTALHLVERCPQVSVFAASLVGQYAYANEHWRAVCEKILAPGARVWTASIHPDDIDAVADAWSTAAENTGDFSAEFRVVRADGSVSRQLATAVIKQDKQQCEPWYLGVAFDCSTLREMQAQLVLAERMASMGVLASGLAHEINNPLAYLVASIDFSIEELRGRLDELSVAGASSATRLTRSLQDALQALTDAREGSDRVRQTVCDLQSFARPDEGGLSRCELSQPLLMKSDNTGSPAVGSGADVPRGERTRILVVDDEPQIGKAVRRILEKEHDVLTVTSGRAALDVLLSDDTYDVILCDLVMPEMTGIDLYEELAHRRPGHEERIVFFTGGACTARVRRFLSLVPNRTLEKPLHGPELLAAIDAIVAPHQPTLRVS